MNKTEWRKEEKVLYLPKNKPMTLEVPEMKFACIRGEGDPNGPHFPEYIEALYAFSYTLKMGLKKSPAPPAGYCDYTVYPLEGVWDLKEEAREEYKSSGGKLNKKDLVFTLMIRQPDFVSASLFEQMKTLALEKKKLTRLADLSFETITEGLCVQMIHRGSYDSEPGSFALMEEFCRAEGHKRKSKVHREIYLSDFRKVAPEKLKTVLRFQVE